MPNHHEGINIFQIRYVFPDFASPLSDVNLATDSSPFLCVSFSVPLRQTHTQTLIHPCVQIKLGIILVSQDLNSFTWTSIMINTLQFSPMGEFRKQKNYTEYLWPSYIWGACGSAGKLVKNPSAMWETWVRSLGWEDPLESSQGNSYALQYSGLENSRDCIVHGVAKSRTRLSDFHFIFLKP